MADMNVGKVIKSTIVTQKVGFEQEKRKTEIETSKNDHKRNEKSDQETGKRTKTRGGSPKNVSNTQSLV